jgi:hypothetical protein
MASVVTDDKSNEVEDRKDETSNLPSLEVAEARIAQALIRYQIRVSKQIVAEEQEAIRP